VSEGTTPEGWSAYDASVPNVAGLPAVVAHTDELRRRRSVPEAGSLASIRDVVVVVSGSRGGSTLFGQVLRRVPGLLHLRAEINPLFALAGLHEGPNRRRVLEEELLLDIGRPPTTALVHDHERYALDVAWRLVLQWPVVAERLDVDELVSIVGGVVQAHAQGDAVQVHLSVLAALHRRGMPVDPGYYDVPTARLDAAFPDRPPPCGPPGSAVVEMPPFVTIGDWTPASTDDLASMPLVLCAPRLSFRLGFVRDLFPGARMRVVHLTRNPAASVNGLMDGWLHHGFFNCEVPAPLDIEGYSDRVPGGRSWWCYDIPPGWEGFVGASLDAVCAFQWRETHVAAMGALDRLGVETLHIRFEDVVGPPDGRLHTFGRLEDWLALPAGAVTDLAGAELPVVMATTRPSPRRWAARAEALGAVLADPATMEVAERLGYTSDPSTWS
jgi:hypothetical protein